MLGLASRPIIERLALDFADQLRRLRAVPQAGVTVFPRAADPPALPRQPVGLTNDQYRELGLSAGLRLIVDEAKDLAQRPHLGPSEMVAKQFQYLGVADRLSGSRRGDADRPHL